LVFFYLIFINHRGELISDEAIRAPQNHIAAVVGIGIRHPKPPAGKALLLPAPAMIPVPAGAWIDGVARQNTSRAATGEQGTGTPQPGEHGVIKASAIALEDHRAIPVQAQPLQIPLNRFNRSGLTAGAVEIIDAQQPNTPVEPGLQPREQRCAQVAQMENPCGRWRKSTAVSGATQGLSTAEWLKQVIRRESEESQ
jgi:hypothetical protein